MPSKRKPSVVGAYVARSFPGQIAEADIERFMRHVEIRAGSCWLWTGHRDRHEGYGQFKWQGKARQAHRFAYAAFNDEVIPEGMTVHHSCHNAACVNPAHLSLMSISQNVAESNRWRGEGERAEVSQEVVPF